MLTILIILNCTDILKLMIMGEFTLSTESGGPKKTRQVIKESSEHGNTRLKR